ncbi:MAG: two-component system nitrogen regulation sensor histidine kinase NtrY [Polyangiales bacterium]|jgi:two-component system nitrogen regulation sensor histidine kinase NtrY
MSLRARLIVFFLIAAFVPLGALGLVVRTSLIKGLEEDHVRRLAIRVASAQRVIEERAEEDRQATQALCRHEPVVDRVLLQVAADRFGPNEEQALVRLLPALMHGRGFDTLHLLQVSGQRGRVLGAGHYPGESGALRVGLLNALMAHEGQLFVHNVRIQGEDGPADHQVLLSGCVEQRDGATIAVLTGRRLDDAVSEDLLGDVSPVHFALVRGDESPELLGSGAPTEVHRFADSDIRLLANIDDEPLQSEIASLKLRSLYVAGAALALALLMAVLLTWTLTRPLEELQAAAKRVAGGDLESRVEVTRRDEVGNAMTAFNEMTRELAVTREKLLRAERIAAWREVARRIAHEIKNPLQPIQMEIETMRKLHARGHPSFDEEFGPSTLLVLDEVKRLNNMVTEFSRFARLPPPRPVLQDILDVVTHVVSLHEGGEVSVVQDAESVMLRFDSEQLTQVLMNLVQNGADAAMARHGDSGGSVRVTLRPLEEESIKGAELRIEDNGTGISAADRLRVFEPYFTTKAKGTGLGLAIVHRIVGDHGGTIDIEDGLDGGAAFVIRLPEAGPPAAIVASLSDASLPLGRAQ